MELYTENNNYKLYNGNMLDMLEVIKPNTVDSIITDPPYGLTSITKRFGKEGSAPASTKNNDGSFARLSKGFMGKEWDGSGIEYNIETWEKCLEVLKPGGYLLAFGGSRTFHRIACAIEDAGFEIRDTICWMYRLRISKIYEYRTCY
jgi:site-specific DNA-methyltransferase (adenine-specific)